MDTNNKATTPVVTSVDSLYVQGLKINEQMYKDSIAKREKHLATLTGDTTDYQQTILEEKLKLAEIQKEIGKSK